jgi:hypothetical protein
VNDHFKVVDDGWRDWLSPDNVLALAGDHRHPPAVAEALGLIESWVRLSLERPLSLHFRSQAKGPTCLLVLPPGALAVVRRGAGKNRLVTCYFKDQVVRRAPPGERWGAVVEVEVKRHCVRRPGRSQFYPPGPTEVVLTPRVDEGCGDRRAAVRFVTLESWGFDPGQPDSPWVGRLGEWPAAGATPRRPQLRLKQPWQDAAEDTFDE